MRRFALLFALLSLAACTGNNPPPVAPEPTPVPVAPATGPGKVIAYLVKAGDAIKTGQPLAVLEAMKMEHTIASPRDGTVAELLFAPGDQVSEGGELLTLE